MCWWWRREVRVAHRTDNDLIIVMRATLFLGTILHRHRTLARVSYVSLAGTPASLECEAMADRTRRRITRHKTEHGPDIPGARVPYFLYVRIVCARRLAEFYDVWNVKKYGASVGPSDTYYQDYKISLIHRL